MNGWFGFLQGKYALYLGLAYGLVISLLCLTRCFITLQAKKIKLVLKQWVEHDDAQS